MKKTYILIKDNKIFTKAALKDSDTQKAIDYGYTLVDAEDYVNIPPQNLKWDGEKIVVTDCIELQAEEFELKQVLNDTDWYVARLTETQTPIPQEILDQRAQARLRISEIREELEQLKKQ